MKQWASILSVMSFFVPFHLSHAKPAPALRKGEGFDTNMKSIESYQVTGKYHPPPGYQDTPSTDITHGPDPDDTSAMRKDPITGTDLTRFGSAYMDSNPVKTGKPGDATGNVASRDNFSH